VRGIRVRGIRPAIVLIALFLIGRAGAQETRSVTVTAESAHSFDDATERALRRAVRETVGVVLVSETKAADFELIRDSIFSRAAGYVRSYKVLDRTRGPDGTYIIRLHAEVSTGSIKDDFLAIRNLFEMMGRPRFVVRVKLASSGDAVTDAPLWIRGKFQELLEEKGLTIIDEETYEEEQKRQRKLATVAGNLLKAKWIGLRLRATYGVRVEAILRVWRDRAHGLALTNYKVSLRTRAVHMVTAEILGTYASEAIAQDQGNLGVVGMKDACEEAVKRAFPGILDRVLYHFTRDLDVARAVTVRTEGLNYDDVKKLADRILALDTVSSAKIHETNELFGEIRVLGRITANDVASRIASWSGGAWVANVTTDRVVTVRHVSPAPPSHKHKHKVDTPAPAGRAPRRRLGGPDSGRNEPNYLWPAAILGAFLLTGLLLAAVILRRK